jgi:hypothetical protein
MAEPDWQRVLGTARAAFDAVRWLAIALPGPRMTTAEAIWYIALESSWAHQQRSQGIEDSAVVFAAFDELERGLREWRWLSARGLPPGATTPQKLPPDYWHGVQLNRLDHLRTDRAPHCSTEQLSTGGSTPTDNVTVSARAVQLRWPRPRP